MNSKLDIESIDSGISERTPSLAQALLPLLVLVVILSSAVFLFGADSSYGPNQIGLLIGSALAMGVGVRNGVSWAQMQDAVVRGVTISTNAIFILLLVGSVIGSWILSGTVPTMIYFGLQLLNPSIFYLAACLICAVIGLSIGSSWTVAGTVGVALMGVAAGMGLDPAIAAGAVVSGAYFGDKLSPLSDTTNLAPAAAGTELFSHIRHMMWTTVPAFIIALVLFLIIGLNAEVSRDAEVFNSLTDSLREKFNVGLHLLIPMIVVLVLAMKRVPAVAVLSLGALLGVVFALIFQWQSCVALGSAYEGSSWLKAVSGAWISLFSGYAAESGNEALDSLINRGGMASMLNTVWLIMCAMAFGAAMERAGLLQRLIIGVLAQVKKQGTLIATTVLTAIGVNVVTSDQFISIVLSGRLFRVEYDRMGLDPLNLSRAIEDGGTLTSALVPWNTCGAYMAATLGVSTFAYAPYAFLNWIGPLVAIGMALAGIKILQAARK